MKLTTLLTFTLATPIFAASPIPGAVTSVTDATTKLQNTLKSWDGHLLSAIPILGDSTALLHAIKQGTSQAKSSDPLTNDETFALVGLTQNLVSAVNGTLETLISMKPKFDKLLMSPVILLNLELEKDASNDFSAAVVEKVPSGLQETAKGLVAPIAVSFDKAINKYCLFKRSRIFRD